METIQTLAIAALEAKRVSEEDRRQQVAAAMLEKFWAWAGVEDPGVELELRSVECDRDLVQVQWNVGGDLLSVISADRNRVEVLWNAGPVQYFAAIGALVEQARQA